MRTLIFFLLLFFAQSLHAQKQDFFRVYDSRGKKIAKGNIFTYSDTSLTLTRRNRFYETPVSQIDIIRSKRTTGHRIAMTTLRVVGIAFIAAGTLFTLNNGGYPRASLGPRQKRIRRDKHTAGNEKGKGPIEKPPKPRKKYKVNADAKKWEETKKALYYYIL